MLLKADCGMRLYWFGYFECELWIKVGSVRGLCGGLEDRRRETGGRGIQLFYSIRFKICGVKYV